MSALLLGTPSLGISGVMTTASAAELTILFNVIFGVDEANLTAITAQLANNAIATNQSERVTAKVKFFYEKDDEDLKK